MRANINGVIAAFIAGKAKGERTCSTDGSTIFSYSLAIAGRRPDGTVWIAPRRSSTATTNSQISACYQMLGICREHADCRDNEELARACFDDMGRR